MASNSTSSQASAGPGPPSSPLPELVELLTDKLIENDRGAIERLLAENPQHSERLHALLPALEILNELGRSAATDGSLHSPPAAPSLPSPPGRGAGGEGGSHISFPSPPHAFTQLDQTIAATPDEHPPAQGLLGDFRIMREIGRGGMGVVYEAEQLSLGRRVALKVLPLAGMLDSRQLERFKNEARAAAGLHHPGIVPVYAVGCERGVHYYAMQFIEGASLAQVVSQQRADQASGGRQPPGDVAGLERIDASKDVEPAARITAVEVANCRMKINERAQSGIGNPHSPESGPFRNIPHSELRTPSSTLRLLASSTLSSPSTRFRQIAEWGVQVAEALDYAHSLGVIHRDIKPANLMLDGQGKVWITDFGLARLEADAGLTLTGDIVGTLRYASPEQAFGARGLVDQRTDVYSLGATLYELLTLRPIFSDGDRARLLQQVAHDDPIAPRRIAPAIPIELETIVLKALDKDPVVRYTTARDLADDLRRFLHEQPIKARPATWIDRASKWSRRNRTLVRWGVAALIATVALLAACTVWVVSERDVAREQAGLAAQRQSQAERAERLAEARQRESEAILESGLDVVDNMLTRTAERLYQQPDADATRKELVERALAFYERFVQNDSKDPAMRVKKADTYGRMAGIRFQRGQPAEAANLCQQRIAIEVALFEQFPDHVSHGLRLARSYGELAFYRGYSTGRIENSPRLAERMDEEAQREQRAYELQYEISRSLAASHPDNVDVLVEYEHGCRNLASGVVQPRPRREPDYRRAVGLARESRATMGRLIDMRPDDALFRMILAQSCATLAGSMVGARMPANEAEPIFREALEAARAADTLSHGADLQRSVRADLLATAAEFFEVRCDRPDEAELLLRDCEALLRALGENHVLEYQPRFAWSALHLAGLLVRQERLSEAIVETRRAVSACEAVSAVPDGPARAADDLSCARMQLAVLLAAEEPPEKGLESIAALAEGFSEQKRTEPTSHLFSHNLASSFSVLGRKLLTAGRYPDAEIALRRALEIRRDSTRAPPLKFAATDIPLTDLWTDLPRRHGMVPNQNYCFVCDSIELARCLCEMGRSGEALTLCREAVPVAENLAEFFSTAPEPRELAARLQKALEECATP